LGKPNYVIKILCPFIHGGRISESPPWFKKLTWRNQAMVMGYGINLNFFVGGDGILGL
jgi:hypothetical protein